MGFTYTPEQQKVIDLHDRNILVAAAAGSGKTAVLVERIVEMISNKEKIVDIDRLLIVTFTNAAASEMRERISDAISKKLEEYPEDEHLQRQTTLIHNAQITTIDSFCLFVIRNYFNEIGLDPGFRVGDSGELTLIQQDVLSELLEGEFEKNEKAFIHCVETYSVNGSERTLEEYILNLYGFSRSYPWPEEWLLQCKEDYVAPTLEEQENALWMKFIINYISRIVEDSIEQIQEALIVCEQPDGPYMYAPLLLEEQDALAVVGRSSTYAEFQLAFSHMTFKRLPSKKDDSVDPAKREIVKGMRNGIKEISKHIMESFFYKEPQLVYEDLVASKDAMATLIDLVIGFAEAFSAKKREKNIVDFADMEHFALDIFLQKKEGEMLPTKTAEAFADHFEEILIDEYQDSNLVQEYLLKSISKSILKEEQAKNNLFMVGDVKQSIYKFRLARPELFMEKYHTYSTQDSREQRIDLHKNFRSRSEVIEAVNYICGQSMEATIGGITYDEDAALYLGADYPEYFLENSKVDITESLQINSQEDRMVDFTESMQINCLEDRIEDVEENLQKNSQEEMQIKGQREKQLQQTELLLAIKPEKDSAKSDATEEQLSLQKAKGQIDKKKEISTKELEASMIAGRIKELVGKFKVTIKGSKEGRFAKYSDIVILLRSNSNWDEPFKKVLTAEGIPTHVVSKTGYFSAFEVQMVLNYLKILDNPYQDIPLCAVMLSPIIGFTEEDLAEIKSFGKGKKEKLYTLLLQYMEVKSLERSKMKSSKNNSNLTSDKSEEGFKNKLLDNIANFQEALLNYRNLVPYTPIHELLLVFIKELGLDLFISAMPAGEQRKANLDMLLEKAVQFEQTSYHGLFHFIRYMERIEKYEVDFGEANILDEKADTVRIMSIHKSKGLEFPICFLAGIGKRFNMMDTRKSMIIDMDYGIGVDYIDPYRRIKMSTLRKNAMVEKMKIDNIGEELRILYVALTRAKEKLIMTGVIENPDKKIANLAGLLTNQKPNLSFLARLNCNSYLDIILSSLIRHRCFKENLENIGIEANATNKMYLKGPEFSVKMVDAETLVGEKVVAHIKEGQKLEWLQNKNLVREVDEELASIMEERFSFSYPYAILSKLYTKTTVSELKRASMEEVLEPIPQIYNQELIDSNEMINQEEEQIEGPIEEFTPYVPKFMRETEKVSGTSRGNAYHKMMELLDFSVVSKWTSCNRKEQVAFLNAKMKELVEIGKLSKEYQEAIEPSKMITFFNSKLAKRMIAAEEKGDLFKEQPFVIGMNANKIDATFPETETILVQGIIDIYFEEEDGLIVVDYKTDRVKDSNLLVKRYQMQLDYYGEALERLTGKKVKEKIIYSFGLGKEIQLYKE